uniref:Hydroxyacid-oxoacid transhydrogenase, mitochondrial n=1 Tax=Sinocyclocheilus anshuiensis TaxID=1608454 RepID=A0A671K2L6_9TELE
MSVSQSVSITVSLNIQVLHHNVKDFYTQIIINIIIIVVILFILLVLFQMACSNIRYGAGVTREIDLQNMGARNVCLMTDRTLSQLPPVGAVLDLLTKHGVKYKIYEDVRVEPTGKSFKAAIDLAKKGHFDVDVAVGGDSVIDTCKAANLYASHPEAEFLDFANAPIGKGKPITATLKPLIAGTKTNSILLFIFSLSTNHLKSSADMLIHYTHKFFNVHFVCLCMRKNILSDNFHKLSFHFLCASHGMSYPIAGNVKTHRDKGYNVEHHIVPHGLSVVLTSPARHLEAAQILGNSSKAKLKTVSNINTSNTLRSFLYDLEVEDGLSAIGYTKEDIPSLVKGTIPQERVTKRSSRAHTDEDLTALFAASMKLY